MRLFWLLISKYSYLPIPRRWQAAQAELPRALALLPLWGLITGLISAVTVCRGLNADSRWLAALLVFLTILSSGAIWLRDIFSVASGLKPPVPPNLAAVADVAMPSALRRENPLPLNRGALITCCLYLLMQYGCFFMLLRLNIHICVYVMAAVSSRFIYLWGVYDFAALPPAFLHSGISRRDFGRAALFCLIIVAVCACISPSFSLSPVPALLAATLFYRRRLNSLGALDEAAYGAAAGWSEILLYLYPILF